MLQEASLTDPLTGLRNRRFFSATIDADVSQALRSHTDDHDPHTRDLVFYLIDADNFKEVNDRFGHDVGDRVLIEMARRISSSIRHSDVLVRWGGEEFLIVSRYTDRKEAELLAQRVLAAVADTPFIISAADGSLYRTCSLGWAPFPWFTEIPRAVTYEEVPAWPTGAFSVPSSPAAIELLVCCPPGVTFHNDSSQAALHASTSGCAGHYGTPRKVLIAKELSSLIVYPRVTEFLSLFNDLVSNSKPGDSGLLPAHRQLICAFAHPIA